MDKTRLKDFLDALVDRFNGFEFIENDPISIPHRYTKKQDREIAGFWTAVLSWGNRKTIINKSLELMRLMDDDPYNFIVNHSISDRKAFLNFKHRTFQPPDTLYFLDFLQRFYRRQDSLESAFFDKVTPSDPVKSALVAFNDLFFDSDNYLQRTRKHIATPTRNSTCKRLNMFLRWMIRSDDRGVDFGIWESCSPKDLMIPMDVHVFKMAKSLKLLHRNKPDWQAVEELTKTLRTLDSKDPIKYDYALFNLGVSKQYDTPIT